MSDFGELTIVAGTVQASSNSGTAFILNPDYAGTCYTSRATKPSRWSKTGHTDRELCWSRQLWLRPATRHGKGKIADLTAATMQQPATGLNPPGYFFMGGSAVTTTEFDALDLASHLMHIRFTTIWQSGHLEEPRRTAPLLDVAAEMRANTAGERWGSWQYVGFIPMGRAGHHAASRDGLSRQATRHERLRKTRCFRTFDKALTTNDYSRSAFCRCRLTQLRN